MKGNLYIKIEYSNKFVCAVTNGHTNEGFNDCYTYIIPVFGNICNRVYISILYSWRNLFALNKRKNLSVLISHQENFYTFYTLLLLGNYVFLYFCISRSIQLKYLNVFNYCSHSLMWTRPLGLHLSLYYLSLY